MQADELLKKLDTHKGKIPVELIKEILALLPSLFELLSRKSLRKQVELQGKLIQAIIEINDEQNKRIQELEQK